MNGDQQQAEILRAIGSLESGFKSLREDMGRVCDFKDEILATRQEFEDCKAHNRGLPGEVATLTTRMDKAERDFKELRILAEGTDAEVRTLKTWATKASGVQLTLNTLIFIVVVATPFIIWWLK
jgi:hypothetical protein